MADETKPAESLKGPTPLHRPWLVAVWPGLGNVAIGAGAYLAETLSMQGEAELAVENRTHDLNHIQVAGGVARTPPRPRSRFFVWKNPDQSDSARDLLLFVGESQPEHGGFSLCRAVVDYALHRGVERVVTFAALGTQLHPADEPGVYGTVTDPALLAELREHGIQPLAEGQLGGLNGVALAAALERGVPAMCLMAEIPYFAAGVPNLKSSRAVLEAFSRLAGIPIELARLDERAEQVTRGLLDLMEQLRRSAGRDTTETGETAEPPESDEAPGGTETPGEPSPETRERIERMFEAARQDRSKAFALKQELDRLGLFKAYEDRFLDLFRRAE